ncbi:MAG TPA: thiol-disulfide isomerase [Bryobacteraceae bacterium]
MLPIRIVLPYFFLTATACAEVTFTHDVAPILYKHCVACHHPDDIAPMSLITYSQVKPWAASIKEAVLLKKMPPWKADPHYGKWSNDPSLTTEEIETLKAWADGSKAEGNPQDLPPAPTFQDGWRIGKPDEIVSIPEHKLEGTGPDEYTYIRVPTNFTEDRWIVAAELRPGNRKVVHHAHVFVKAPDTPKPAASAGAKAAPDPVQQYSKWLQVHEGTLSWVRPEAPVIDDGCAVDDNGQFPGHVVGELNLLSSYLPGRGPDVYPEGTARKIPAGSTLEFQIHYSHTTGKPEMDATSVGLIFAKEPPRQVSRRIDLSNHLFMIPPGAANQEVTECHTFNRDLYITSLTPHMHYRGKSMRIEAKLPDGQTETLLNVPEYNFNWQITYRPVEPIHLPKGTRIMIDAHFDNSRNNALNPNPAQTVRWGAASENEMMDGWIEFVDSPPGVATSKLAVNGRK